MIIPLVGQSYTEFSTVLDAQTCKNFFLVQDKDGKFPTALYPTPGLTLFSSGSGNQVRGMFETNGITYAVIDNTFYKINSDGTSASLGTLISSTGRCRFISNTSNGVASQIMISDGLYGYTYTIATNTFAQITTAQFLGCDTLCYMDGYAIFNVPGENLFQTSGPLDFTSYNSTFSAQITSWAEPIVAIVPFKRNLWMFTSRGAELWWNAGAINLTFNRQEGNLVTQGLAAKDSVVATDNTLIWLSKNQYGQGLVVEWNYYTVNTISTHAVNTAISGYSRIDDAFAYSFTQNGNLFYVLTFPTANATWVYNSATQSWHEWNYWQNNTLPGEPNIQGRHLSNCYAFCYNKNLVGDYQSGNIYYIDPSNYTDNGNPIIRERACRHLYQEGKFVSVYNFILELEYGIGLQNGQGSNPQVMLQISKDGGRTFGPELWQSIGQIGQYTYRAVWPSLGMARDWVFRIRVSDPIKCVILGATADVEVGDN